MFLFKYMKYGKNYLSTIAFVECACVQEKKLSH